MSNLAAAEVYAARGWPIFPLAPKTKFPLKDSHGWKDASTTTTAWKQQPARNIGLACAFAQCVLLDADTPDALVGLDLPPTWTVRATRGPHLYFKLPEGTEPTIDRPGLDVITRGYGLLPPSIHPSGHRYRWEPGRHPWAMPLATLPQQYTRPATARPEYEADGEARATLLGHAFERLGMVRGDFGDRIAVDCPWTGEHSSPSTLTSTVVLAPSVGGLRVGRFRCLHGHCRNRRSDQVIKWMPREALEAAALAGYRREYRVTRGL